MHSRVEACQAMPVLTIAVRCRQLWTTQAGKLLLGYTWYCAKLELVLLFPFAAVDQALRWLLYQLNLRAKSC